MRLYSGTTNVADKWGQYYNYNSASNMPQQSLWFMNLPAGNYTYRTSQNSGLAGDGTYTKYLFGIRTFGSKQAVSVL